MFIANRIDGTKPDPLAGVRDELDVSGISKEELLKMWASAFPTLSKSQLKKFRKLIYGKLIVYGTVTK